MILEMNYLDSMAYYDESREKMIRHQLRARGIEDEAILASFQKVPREFFVPEELRTRAYADDPLPIGHGQNVSQPYVAALMIKMLEPTRGDVVLEIGTGRGFQAAILSHLVARVVSIEIIPELGFDARFNLSILNLNNVEVHVADGTVHAGAGEYDKILVSAAVPEAAPAWATALTEKGTLVIPRGNRHVQFLEKYRKDGEELKMIEKGQPVKFVPLRGIHGLH